MPIGQATFLANVVTGAGVTTFTFAEVMGFIEIRNLGPASAWCTFDGVTVPTPGVTMSGQTEVGAGQTLTLNGIAVLTILARCTPGNTAGVEITGLPNG